MGRWKRRGFTLVELLVVIGVIGVLISILIPVLGKVRRKAIVLASPVCFQTFDDNALHLTDGFGRHDLPITPYFGWVHARRPGNAMWSPNGLRIGFELSNWPLGDQSLPQYLCVLDPMSGAMQKIPQLPSEPRSYFAGWYDNDHVIEDSRGAIYVRNIDTGQVVRSVPQESSAHTYCTVPAGLPGRWIAVYGRSVRFIKPDFSPGRPIWIAGPGELPPSDDFVIDIDPYGEWAAWTVSNGGSMRKLAFKAVAAPASAPPTYMPINTQTGFFVAWTDEGNMLFQSGSDGAMTVVNKDGEVVRRMSFDDHPFGEVSWRRYGRQ